MIKIEYDMQLDDVIAQVNHVLMQDHNLMFELVDDGDGWLEYEIVKMEPEIVTIQTPMKDGMTLVTDMKL